MNGRLLYASLTVAAALPAAAAIRVTRDGAPVPSAEICYFAAVGTETPFVQQFASNSVSCSATLPRGLWNVFARQGSRFISGRVAFVDARVSTPDVELRLEPAATIEFLDIPSAAYGAAYLTDTLSLFPLPKRESKLLVPASRSLLPLLVSNRSIVRVGSPIRMDEGSVGRAEFPPGRSVVTWLSIAPADLTALHAARKPRLPEVVAAGARPINPVSGTINLDKAVQVFRGAAATLEVRGSGWRPQKIRVDPSDKAVVVTAEPLRLVPAATLVVDWYAAQDLAALSEQRVTDCKPEPKKSAARLSVMKCRRPDLRHFDLEGCTRLAEQNLSRQEKSGNVRFDDLDEGAKVLEVVYGDLPPIRRVVTLRKFDEELIRLPIEYSSLFGKVTVGGKSLGSAIEMRIDFDSEKRAVTTADGDYVAVMEKPLPKDRIIHFRSCDGTMDSAFIVDRDVAPNSRYDIDLPANELTVETVDAQSGAPVPGARVRYGAFRSDEMSSVYFYRVANSLTGDDGRVVVKNISPDKTIHVCAEHADYEKACADTFTMTSTQAKTLRVSMEPRGGFRGRVIAAQPIMGGDLYWFGLDGQQTEFVPIKPDGSFRFTREHRPDEVIVVVTTNLPLYIQRQPMLQSGDELQIAIPVAPARSFEVSIETLPQTDAIVTIAVGDLIVPYPAFAQHLALHGSMLDLRNRGPLLVPEILETAPLSVLLGPSPNEIGPDLRRIDLFRLPQYRGVPRKPVTSARVIF